MRERHWDETYAAHGPASVSWYERTPRVSLEIISSLDLPRDLPLIDVGGGASGLARELRALGYTDVSVLDVSEVALRDARGDGVTLLHEDVLRWRPNRAYALWHDRAVLHFFTEDRDRDAYRQTLKAATATDAFVVIGAFAPEGPDRCSGLPVRRYGVEELQQFLGDGFTLRAERHEVHVTPKGVAQPFAWALFERLSSGAPLP